METREMTVKNKMGIHGRVSAEIGMLCEEFQCDVFIEYNGSLYKGDCLLSLLGAAITYGQLINVSVDARECDVIFARLEQIL